jgi:HTH-type transcriptional regulator/antitoxin HipB
LTDIRFANNLSLVTRATKEQRLTNESQAVELMRQRRKAKGLSQQQLASKLGVTQARLSEIESGRAHLSVERLIAVAALLGLELVLREAPPKPAAEW